MNENATLLFTVRFNHTDGADSQESNKVAIDDKFWCIISII